MWDLYHSSDDPESDVTCEDEECDDFKANRYTKAAADDCCPEELAVIKKVPKVKFGPKI